MTATFAHLRFLLTCVRNVRNEMKWDETTATLGPSLPSLQNYPGPIKVSHPTPHNQDILWDHQNCSKPTTNFHEHYVLTPTILRPPMPSTISRSLKTPPYQSKPPNNSIWPGLTLGPTPMSQANHDLSRHHQSYPSHSRPSSPSPRPTMS